MEEGFSVGKAASAGDVASGGEEKVAGVGEGIAETENGGVAAAGELSVEVSEREEAEV